MLKQVIDGALITLLLVTHLARAQVTGTVELVSKAAEPSFEGTSGGFLASMSADGRYAAFVTRAPNVLSGQVDNNKDEDVFLYDRVTGVTVLVSHAAGAPLRAGNGPSYAPVISANGQSIAFVSVASNLMAGVDTNGSGDAFLYDHASSIVSLVSHVAGAPTTAAGRVDRYLGPPVVSADGNLVAFASGATNLTAGQVDTPYTNDVFLFDRASGAIELVSHIPGSAVATANGGANSPVISADGGHIAFESWATNLVAGQIDTDRAEGVFLFERASGVVSLVTHAAGTPTVPANAGPFKYAISGDGGFVAFASSATNLVAGQADTNRSLDVFLYDRTSAAISLVSHRPGAPGAAPARGGSLYPAISADGHRVAFASSADNLVQGQVDAAFTLDAFVYDHASGVVSLVSHVGGDPTTAANAESGAPAISADGQVVAFHSGATDIASGILDANDSEDVFLYDSSSTLVSLVSHSWETPAVAANASSHSPLISNNGNTVGFSSAATDLVPGQGIDRAVWDAFLFDRASSMVGLASRLEGLPSVTANGSSGPTLTDTLATSADGRFVAFLSHATNLIAGQADENGAADAFLYDRSTGDMVLISHTPGSPTTTADCVHGSTGQIRVSADGAFVVFASGATNLVAGQVDTNDGSDVFLYERATGLMSLVSHAPGTLTTTGDSDSRSPAISGDGVVVAFVSSATNLVGGQVDSAYGSDVFLYERSSAALSLVSHAADSAVTSTNGASYALAMSADGSKVAFESSATNLVDGQSDANSGSDVFLYDRITGELSLVSHTPASETATGSTASGAPTISADGSLVGFESRASDLISSQSDDNDGCDFWGICWGADVFLYDSATRGLTLVSHVTSAPTTTGNSSSSRHTLSAGGRFVAFESRSTNLVAGQIDTNNAEDVFVYDHVSGVVTLASHPPDSPTRAGNGASGAPAMSGDGASVAFTSGATDLVAGQADTNNASDVFLLRHVSDVVSLVTRVPGAQAATGNGHSSSPSISADGKVVVFASFADDFIGADYNLASDVFLFVAQLPGITVNPTAGLTTQEAGTAAQVTVVLDTQPIAEVTIGIGSSDPTEMSVSPAALTFTPLDWSTPQVVTVIGVDDPDLDGPIAFTVVTAPAVSTDPEYSGLDAADVAGINLDNEVGPDPRRPSRPHRHLTRRP